MLFKKKPHRPQSRIDTLVGATTQIRGDIVFSGGLRIDGRVEGNVYSEEGAASTLVLSEQAHVNGEIRVSHVVINGTVNGPVYAKEYVELQPKARVRGDVFYKTVEMHLGAIVEGKLVHQGGGDQPDAEVSRSVIDAATASGT